MALVHLTLTSVSNGRVLDVPNGTPENGALITVEPTPGSAPSWRVNTGSGGESGFTIVNDTTNKCLDADRPYYQVRQQPCDGRATEKWYFQPVSDSAQKAFMIRHESDNRCLTTQIPPKNDKWTYTNDCDGSQYQQWLLPAEAYQTALDTAVDYAAARCVKDRSLCSWTTTSQEKPKLLPGTCVSPVWFNGTSTSIQWTFSLNTSTGWENTIGVTLQTKLTVGGGDYLPLALEIAASVTGEISMNLKQDLGNSLLVTVPSRQYGWVTLSELATKAKGVWTFDLQGLPWTATDEITVPLKNDPEGGASIYAANTNTTFTSCNTPPV